MQPFSLPLLLLALLLQLVLAAEAHAHRTSDAYFSVDVTGTQISGHASFALRDLDLLVALDRDQNGAITWAELKANDPALQRILKQQIALRAKDTVCPVQWSALTAELRQQEYYARYTLLASCPPTADHIELDYRFLQSQDPAHRALVQTANAVHIVAPGQSLPLAPINTWHRFADFAAAGVHHIAIGYDHLLFLLCLLLPAALRRRDKHWQAEPDRRRILLDMLTLVTSFTVAHSITLLLAGLLLFAPPATLVESAIAGSVLLAALNVLKPMVIKRLWLLTFAFGLIHGFGFAAVLAELHLPAGQRAASLLAFNLGVELGQLAVVLALLPLLLWLRHQSWYGKRLLPAGAVVTCVIASIWFIERTAEVDLFGRISPL